MSLRRQLTEQGVTGGVALHAGVDGGSVFEAVWWRLWRHRDRVMMTIEVADANARIRLLIKGKQWWKWCWLWC